MQAVIAGLYHIEPDYQQEGHMADTRYYSIGELAELCSVSSKSLRYYDTIGLLSPEHKNDDTGYRYYTKQQVFDVFLIKKLQNLGFSLKEIQDYAKDSFSKFHKSYKRFINPHIYKVSLSSNLKELKHELILKFKGIEK